MSTEVEAAGNIGVVLAPRERGSASLHASLDSLHAELGGMAPDPNEALPTSRDWSEQFRRFLDTSGDLLCVWDAHGQFRGGNPACEELLGFFGDRLRARQLLDLVHPQDRETTLKELEALDSDGFVCFENRVRDEAGHYRRISWRVMVAGSERWVFASGRDITGQADAVASLVRVITMAESTNRDLSFQKFALDQHAIVAITDRRGRITYVNDKFCDISGYTRDELLGQDHRIVNSGNHDKQFFRDLYRTIAGGGVWRGEICNRAKDGHLYWVDTTIVPYRNRDNEVDGYVAIRADISERKRSESLMDATRQELVRQNQKLVEFTERAQRFVDDVSHEFRTPLAVIKEFVAIIADGLAGPVTPDQAHYLGVVDNAVVDLNQMVEDFLDSSKLRTGQLRVDRLAQPVDQIISRCRPGLLKKAASRSITLLERIEPGLPLVFADEEKVRRIIMNLGTNAIKFSPDGSQVEVWAKSDRRGGILIGVTDHGRGLTPQDLTKLFQRFSRLPNSDTPSVKGFGLGLNIARQLVWLNLGEIRVESTEGQGSTFSFSLPSNDPRVILERFFARLTEREAVEDAIAIISVRPRDRSDSQAALRRFMALTTRPTDVILDLLTQQQPGVIAIGPTASAESWISRLQTAHARSLEDSGSAHVGPLELEILGTYAYPAQTTEAMEAACAHVLEEHSVA